MTIRLEDIGKRYQRHWVFRNMSYAFTPGSKTAILGQNGSGKSTLLRITAGMQPPSSGKIVWENLTQAEVFRNVAFCAPGMELPEELSLHETLEFHFAFKNPLPGMDIADVIDLTGLRAAARKPIGDYSSGMRQRVKLAQAICSDTPYLLLDEPCSNLDEAGVAQYNEWMAQFAGSRTVIIASNDPREYRFCDAELLMRDYS